MVTQDTRKISATIRQYFPASTLSDDTKVEWLSVFEEVGLDYRNDAERICIGIRRAAQNRNPSNPQCLTPDELKRHLRAVMNPTQTLSDVADEYERKKAQEERERDEYTAQARREVERVEALGDKIIEEMTQVAIEGETTRFGRDYFQRANWRTSCTLRRAILKAYAEKQQTHTMEEVI